MVRLQAGGCATQTVVQLDQPSRAGAMQFFDGSFHGWTVRGNDTDPEMAPQIVDAFERARDWFFKHL